MNKRPQSLPVELEEAWKLLNISVISTDDYFAYSLGTRRQKAREQLEGLVELGYAKAGPIPAGENWRYEDGTPVEILYSIRRVKLTTKFRDLISSTANKISNLIQRYI